MVYSFEINPGYSHLEIVAVTPAVKEMNEITNLEEYWYKLMTARMPCTVLYR